MVSLIVAKGDNMGVLDRRLLGPIKSNMGGNPVESTGGGGGSLTISNNVDGYVLQATGNPNEIKGIPQLQWNASQTALSASADIFVTGSNNYLYLHGSDGEGNIVRFRFRVSGSMLQIQPDAPEGTL
jgi:hypothetical protein